MNDDQALRDLLRGAGTQPTEAFRTSLRHRLQSELEGLPLIDAGDDPSASTSLHPGGTWRWVAVAAAVLAVLTGVVVTRSSANRVGTPDTVSTVPSTYPPSTSAARTRDDDLRTALATHVWVLTDAGERGIPSPVPFLAPLPAGTDGLMATYDGCNRGVARGALEAGRLRIDVRASTLAACPGIDTVALPAEAALVLSDGGRTLTIAGDGVGAPTLTFRRSDRMGRPATAEDLAGRWSWGEVASVIFRADGTLTAGDCSLTWVLSGASSLSVYGKDAITSGTCPAAFIRSVTSGPRAASIDEAGVLWLVADGSVLRLFDVDPTVASEPFPLVEVESRQVPIEGLDPCAPGSCPSVTVAPDGTIVTYDASTRTLRIGRRGSDAPRTVIVSGATAGRGYLVGVGPDDVAYLVVQAAGSPDPVGDVIAVPFSGDRAGQIVATDPVASGGMDMSGDTTLVAARSGWVAVGCCGFESVLPVLDRLPLIGWVDRTGADIAFDRPVLSMERDGDIVTFMRTEADSRRAAWAVPADQTLGMRGMPDAALLADGSILLTWNTTDGSLRLVRLRADGGIEEIVVPAALSIVALSPTGGAVMYDGSGYLYWPL